MAELFPVQAGDPIYLCYEGTETYGSVLLASTNSKSLMLKFEAILGGYVGMMPVLWNDGTSEYLDLIQGQPVVIHKR